MNGWARHRITWHESRSLLTFRSKEFEPVHWSIRLWLWPKYTQFCSTNSKHFFEVFVTLMMSPCSAIERLLPPPHIKQARRTFESIYQLSELQASRFIANNESSERIPRMSHPVFLYLIGNFSSIFHISWRWRQLYEWIRKCIPIALGIGLVGEFDSETSNYFDVIQSALSGGNCKWYILSWKVILVSNSSSVRY